MKLVPKAYYIISLSLDLTFLLVAYSICTKNSMGAYFWHLYQNEICVRCIVFVLTSRDTSDGKTTTIFSIIE